MYKLERPEEPLPSDCCNSGCSPCIIDVYKDLLIKWEKECKSTNSEQTTQALHVIHSEHPVLSPTKYSCFMVKHIENVCPDTFVYRLQAVMKETDLTANVVKYCEVSQPLNFHPAQYFILQGSFKNESKESLLSRPYTPIFDQLLIKSGSFEVMVKLYPGGQMSQYWQSLQPGDITLWRGPYGDFSYKRNTFSHVLMLCAGTGLAPMYSVANSVVHDDLDDTFIKMLYCCSNIKNIIFRTALHALTSYWNFDVDIYLSHEQESNFKALYGETIKSVRITEDIIASELKKINAGNTLVLICGNSVFCSEMNKYVKQCGLNIKEVRVFS